MTQIFAARPVQYSNKILCRYHNPSPNLQIARITNIPHWYFERVVFPGDLLLFEAVVGATLEIYSGNPITALLSDCIGCEYLQVKTSTDSIS